MHPRPPDPRERYRVRCDVEMERGEAGAWERYQHAASLCERAPEEWEWSRVAIESAGVTELIMQTPTGRVRIVPSPLLAPGSDAFLLGNALIVTPADFGRLVVEANQLRRFSVPL